MKTELHNINNAVSEMISMILPKAELPHVGFFPHPFIYMRHFIAKKVGNRRN